MARGGLAFDVPGGPLVAVCGLAGGSGATTLALCLAQHAASQSRAPVLVAEDDACQGGLAVRTGQATPHSLSELADRAACGEPPEPAFTPLAPRLRMIAAGPRRTATTDRDHLRALLRQARAAHGLVIVDCGTSWFTAGGVLEHATHVVWTLAATPAGVARAHMLFASDAVPARGRAREAMAAIALHPRAKARVRALRRLATQRCERLILVPHSLQAPRGALADDHQVERALAGLAPTLRRTP